jgi:hypothetical protein
MTTAELRRSLDHALRYRVQGGEVTVCPCGTHVTAHGPCADLWALGVRAMKAHFDSGDCALANGLAFEGGT